MNFLLQIQLRRSSTYIQKIIRPRIQIIEINIRICYRLGTEIYKTYRSKTARNLNLPEIGWDVATYHYFLHGSLEPCASASRTPTVVRHAASCPSPHLAVFRIFCETNNIVGFRKGSVDWKIGVYFIWRYVLYRFILLTIGTRLSLSEKRTDSIKWYMQIKSTTL